MPAARKHTGTPMCRHVPLHPVFLSLLHTPSPVFPHSRRHEGYVVSSAPIVLHGPERCVSGAELIGLALSSMCWFFPSVVPFLRGHGVVNRVSVCNTGSSIPITPQSPKCWGYRLVLPYPGHGWSCLVQLSLCQPGPLWAAL